REDSVAMKILLLTSNGYGHALLPALRGLGHDVTVAVADEPSLAAMPYAKDVATLAREAKVDFHLVDPERGKGGAVLRAVKPDLIARATSGQLAGEPIDGGDATHLPPVQPRDGIISFNEPTSAIVNRVRATTGYPGAFALLGEKKLRIKKARIVAKAGLEIGA